MSAAAIANEIAKLVVALTFLNMLGTSWRLLPLRVFTFAAFVLAYLLAPETRGLSLEDRSPVGSIELGRGHREDLVWGRPTFKPAQLDRRRRLSCPRRKTL